MNSNLGCCHVYPCSSTRDNIITQINKEIWNISNNNFPEALALVKCPRKHPYATPCNFTENMFHPNNTKRQNCAARSMYTRDALRVNTSARTGVI